MTDITMHKSRLPSEAKVWEVSFNGFPTRGYRKIGSIFFAKEDEKVFQEIEVDISEEVNRKEFLCKAAKNLIRERGARDVLDKDGDSIAKIEVTEKYERE